MFWFGAPISDFQETRFKLARMASEIEAARQLMYDLAMLMDDGQPADKEAAMVKWYASEMARRVTSDALAQVATRHRPDSDRQAGRQRANHDPMVQATGCRARQSAWGSGQGCDNINRESARVAAMFDGQVSPMTFEEVTRVETADLGYLTGFERNRVRRTGSGEIVDMALRVTTVFRREEDGWKLVLRHADRISSC